ALKAIRQAARMRVTPGLRTEAIAALVLPDVEVVHEWEGWPDDAIGLAFDADFKNYARLDKQGRLTVCRLSGGREEIIHRLPAHGNPPFGGVGMSPTAASRPTRIAGGPTGCPPGCASGRSMDRPG